MAVTGATPCVGAVAERARDPGRPVCQSFSSVPDGNHSGIHTRTKVSLGTQ